MHIDGKANVVIICLHFSLVHTVVRMHGEPIRAQEKNFEFFMIVHTEVHCRI